MRIKNTIFFLILVANLVILSEVYIELDEVKGFLNDKSIIYNVEARKLPTIQDLIDKRRSEERSVGKECRL